MCAVCHVCVHVCARVYLCVCVCVCVCSLPIDLLATALYTNNPIFSRHIFDLSIRI